MSREVETRVGEFLPIERRFQVEIDASPSLGDGVGKRRLADLTRTEQGHAGKWLRRCRMSAAMRRGIILAIMACDSRFARTMTRYACRRLHRWPRCRAGPASRPVGRSGHCRV